MANGVPAGLLALAAGSGNRQGFGPQFSGSLGLLANAQSDQAAQSSRQFEQMLKMAAMEREIQAEETAAAQKAERDAAVQSYAGSLPQDQRQLFSLFPQKFAEAQIGQTFQDPQDPTGLMQNVEAGGMAPGSPEYQAMIQKVLTQPKTQVTVNQPKLPPGYMPRDPSGDLSKGVVPTPGGPADPATLTTKQRNDLSLARKTAGSLTKQFDRYEKLVKKYGSEVIPGVAADQLAQQRNSIMLEMKELFNLGVINGPDLEILSKIILNPTSVVNVGRDIVATLTGKERMQERLLQNIESLREQSSDRLQALEEGVGIGAQPKEAPSSDLSAVSQAELEALKRKLSGAHP